jgi:2-oxoglutarate ferredoxin oxidoreductase subunit alpha
MEKLFMKGNEAIAESAIRAGCRFFAGYPITPQNEIPEYMARRMPEVGGVFVQGESEIASAYMVYGGSSMGVRCMTSSSGLGICLKSEAISYMAGARLPAVIVDIARGGPGLGTIQPAQQDYHFLTKGLGSGGFSCVVYAPSSVQEAADLTFKAFEMAQRDRNPVVILADGCLGTMMETVELPAGISPSGASEWSLAKGDRSYRAVKSFNIEPVDQEYFLKELEAMYLGWEKDIMAELYHAEDAEYLIAAYGISGRIAKTAVQMLRSKGIACGLIRPITLNPFPCGIFASLNSDRVRGLLVVEMSIPGQMISDVRSAANRDIPVEFFGRSGGVIVQESEIADAMKELIRRVEEKK